MHSNYSIISLVLFCLFKTTHRLFGHFDIFQWNFTWQLLIFEGIFHFHEIFWISGNYYYDCIAVTYLLLGLFFFWWANFCVKVPFISTVCACVFVYCIAFKAIERPCELNKWTVSCKNIFKQIKLCAIFANFCCRCRCSSSKTKGFSSATTCAFNANWSFCTVPQQCTPPLIPTC